MREILINCIIILLIIQAILYVINLAVWIWMKITNRY